ncbi:PA14 domain-containing protein [Euzebyella marina]|uniref:Ig-like domain-containing protein n=1 Tax=Euzebyella marina TaxID=1761453 RepID=UPI0036277E7B
MGLLSAQQVYMDAFSTNAYTNNDGNTNFSNAWGEADNAGGGATGGNISVNSGSLVFNGLRSADYIYRNLDLSGVTKDVELSFSYNATSRGDERLRVYLFNASTNTWENITTLQVSTASTVTYTLTAGQKSNQSGIAFQSSSGDWSVGEIIRIDNVAFRIEDQPPVITATGNQDYCPGTSVPVVETVSISDPDDSTIQEVSVQISNGYINGEDILTLAGTHPNITASWIPAEGRLLLSGPATSTEFESAVSAVLFSSSSASPSGTRDFSIIVGDAYFLPDTGHYYQFFSDLGITWTSARDKAALSTYYGLQGYLATLTSLEEANFAGSQISGAGWIGGSDAAVENEWRWVTGPEAGTVFWNGLAGGSTPNYAFWNTGEPNQSGDEDYAHITEDGTGIDGSWNDLSNTGAGSGAYQPKGYVVEYGGMPGDPTIDVSASTSLTVDEDPVITAQPVDQAIVDGGDATFSVSATGGTLLYQWQVSTNDGASYTNISGATSSSVTINNVTFSDEGNRYRVLISESGSSCAAIASDYGVLSILMDSDGDGYADAYDLDDDNDGILDSEELGSCYGTLAYEFYDLTPPGNTVDNIPTTGALSTGSITSFDVDALQGAVDPGDADSFAIRYTGLIDIAAAGSYTFYTTSDDGSKLYINGLEVVNNDFDHGPQERSGVINLTAGLHDIEVLFFENGGGESLLVQYEGPSLAKQSIPFTAFYEGTCDIDGDGLANHLDDDSDGDGCSDADEAYGASGTDVDGNGMYGSGNPTVNSDGTVQAASYATPNDGDSNGEDDYKETVNAPVVPTSNTTETACNGGNISFSLTTNFADTHQWQFYNGSSWIDLADGGIYSGTDTNTLNLNGVTLAENGNQYRLVASYSGNVCREAISGTTTLSVIQPTVDAGADQTICDGESATLTAVGSGGSGSGYTYLWSTGETSSSITVSPVGNTNNNVDVDYTVTVTDSFGCTNSDVVRVTVEPTPTITVSSSPSCNFRLFQPTTYTLEVTVSAGSVTSTNGTVSNLGGNVWRIADVPDGTDITVTVSQGNCSRNLPVTAPNCTCPTVNAPVSGGDQEFCAGSPVPTLTATVGNNETVNWYDSISGGTWLQSNSTSYTPSSAGTYYAETINTFTGCTSNSRTAVRAIQNALPVVDAGPNVQICDGDSTTLTASASGGSGSGYSYLWSTGETSQAITVAPTGSANSNTTVPYSVTVTDSNGCEQTDSVNVTIYSRPQAIITTNDATCNVNNGSFTLSFPNHPNRTSIQFSLDGGATYRTNVADNSGSVTYGGLSGGTYNIWARWGNSACPVELGTYTINTVPVVTVVSEPIDQTIFVGQNTSFSVSANNADTYQWQVSTDGGAGFVDISDNAFYSGSQTNSLNISTPEIDFNGNIYRVRITNSSTSCAPTTSQIATLTVKVRTVISNRRITYRTKKN